MHAEWLRWRTDALRVLCAAECLDFGGVELAEYADVSLERHCPLPPPLLPARLRPSIAGAKIRVESSGCDTRAENRDKGVLSLPICAARHLPPPTFAFHRRKIARDPPPDQAHQSSPQPFVLLDMPLVQRRPSKPRPVFEKRVVARPKRKDALYFPKRQVRANLESLPLDAALPRLPGPTCCFLSKRRGVADGLVRVQAPRIAARVEVNARALQHHALVDALETRALPAALEIAECDFERDAAALRVGHTILPIPSSCASPEAISGVVARVLSAAVDAHMLEAAPNVVADSGQ